MKEVTPEQFREGVILRVGTRLWRVGYLEPIRLTNGNYCVEDPREVTNVHSQA